MNRHLVPAPDGDKEIFRVDHSGVSGGKDIWLQIPNDALLNAMIGYYKKHVFALKRLLNRVDPNDENLDKLIEIQVYIYKRIVNAEERIRERKDNLLRLKQQLRHSRLPKAKSLQIKKQITLQNKRVDEYRFLIFVWRCFGDGVVFKFIKKWNLKRLLYAHDSTNVKQNAGFISGKDGLLREFSFVLEAKKNNVPAILCDLTNSIRHGDVCLLGDDDPVVVVEVKSSENTSKRTTRQIKAITAIHEYLQNDVGDIGGSKGVHRVDLPKKEIHFNKEMNSVINSALSNGHCYSSPEAGLIYLVSRVVRGLDCEKVLKGIAEPTVFFLNDFKTNMSWGNYYPFTLSIRSPEALYSFLRGDLTIMVVVDGAVIKRMANEIGYTCEIVMSDNIAFRLSKEIEGWDEPFTADVSEHFAYRLVVEFLSLKWFFEVNKSYMSWIIDDIQAQIKNNSTVK